MNSILSQMLEKYTLTSKQDYINALKEIVQEIALSALAKTDFFESAAFYGGTALRIFYGLDRFSEDLDFSLLSQKNFDISQYFKTLEDTFKIYGFNFKAEIKDKTMDSSIQSAFLKGNTLEQLLIIEVKNNITNYIQRNETIKIKFEIDINPPLYANTELKYGILPMPYQIRIYDKPSLFAGKIHAILCRDWKSRVKGRDLYDFVFYLSNHVKPNLAHLQARLEQSGKWDHRLTLSTDALKTLLRNRFMQIDFALAKQDVLPFMSDSSKIQLWSEAFFVSITDQML